MSRSLEYKNSLIGHKGQVWKISWNPMPCDGAEHMLASAGDDTLIVWSCNKSRWTSKDLKSKKHLRSCAWHPDGLVLAAGDWNDVILWRYDEAKEEFSVMTEIQHLNNEEIMNLSWNETGKLLLCCTKGHIAIIREHRGAYEMYEVKDGKGVVEIDKAASIDSNLNNTYHKHGGGVNAISFGTQSGRIVTAGDDFCLKFWRLDIETKEHLSSSMAVTKETWRFETSLNEHNAGITCTDWSRRSNLIASACRGRTICVYEDHKKVYVLSAKRTRAHKGPIHDIKWCCEEPNMLASAGGDMVVNIWTLSHHQLLRRCLHYIRAVLLAAGLIPSSQQDPVADTQGIDDKAASRPKRVVKPNPRYGGPDWST